MKNILTSTEGKEIKTYKDLLELENVSLDETGTIEYKVLLNGQPCTIYRHWSNRDSGFFVYEGNEVSNEIAKVQVKWTYPEDGNPYTQEYKQRINELSLINIEYNL